MKIDVPSKLKNMAVWDYWDNADWAVEIGVGATRRILSIAAGWIWFILLGPTRTSIGYICPVEHYKKMKMKPEVPRAGGRAEPGSEAVQERQA